MNELHSSERLLSEHSLQALQPFENAPEHLKLMFGVRRHTKSIEFDFVFFGRVAAELEKLVLPPMAERRSNRRKHDLWKTTCMEIFVGADDGSAYLELNLAPSGDWNVYAFDSYRAGQREVPEARAVWTRSENAGDRASWHGRLFSVQSGALTTLLSARQLVMSATCVMEYKAGPKEYWALAHAGDKPDFHRRESFRLFL